MKNSTLTTAAALAAALWTGGYAQVPVTDIWSASAESGYTAKEHGDRGDAFFKKKDFDKAVNSYTMAINIEPNNEKYYLYRGMAYYEQGDYGRANKDFTSAINHSVVKIVDDNTYALCYGSRGHSYYALGKYAEAVRDYEEAVRFNPGNGAYKQSLAAAKAMLASPPANNSVKITFTSPATSPRSDYAVRACVKAGGRVVDRVSLTVNGSATRGISVSRGDGCDHTVNQVVALRDGENTIGIEATAGGVSASETFVVTYRQEPISPTVTPAGPPAVDGHRVALVVGNANYKNSPLRNSVNDANQVAAKLRGLNFTVTAVSDADNRTMRRAINEFAESSKGSAIALFYYAGHGVQHENISYLLPVDIENLNRLGDLTEDATSIDRVLRALDDSRARVKIVMLDACRSNAITRSASGGLAAPGTTPEGTFIVFATAPGQVALDNSTFTKSFLKYVDTPGLKIEDLFKNVLSDVRKTTGGSQIPWVQSSLEGNFYFKR